MSALAHALEWFFVAYLVAFHGSAIALNLMAIPALYRMRLRAVDERAPGHAGFAPPLSLLVAAHDEAGSIVNTVRSLQQLDYPQLEIVVVNDGSTDGTLDALRAAFALEPFPEAYWRRIHTRAVRGVYRSRSVPNLRVLDKDHGGRADALNAAINASRYPLFCAVDSASLMQRDSLARLVEPFLEDPSTVGAAGLVRFADGCRVAGDRLEPGLPSRPLTLLQIVEQLRDALFVPLGWSRLNALLLLDHAFVVFRKDSVVEAGGYRPEAARPHMELVARLHRELRTRRERYRFHCVPDATCWIAAAASWPALKAQHMAQHRALADTLRRHASLAETRSGAVGLLALPFHTTYQCFGPLIEMAGYAAMALLFLAGVIGAAELGAYLLLAFSLGLLATLSALLLEQSSIRLYPRLSQAALLAGVAIVENAGFRQVLAAWRAVSLVRWLRGRPA